MIKKLKETSQNIGGMWNVIGDGWWLKNEFCIR